MYDGETCIKEGPTKSLNCCPVSGEDMNLDAEAITPGEENFLDSINQTPSSNADGSDASPTADQQIPVNSRRSRINKRLSVELRRLDVEPGCNGTYSALSGTKRRRVNQVIHDGVQNGGRYCTVALADPVKGQAHSKTATELNAARGSCKSVNRASVVNHQPGIHWVQCDACAKWRSLPDGHQVRRPAVLYLFICERLH